MSSKASDQNNGQGKINASSSFFHDIPSTEERSSSTTTSSSSYTRDPNRQHPFQPTNHENEGEGDVHPVKVYKDDMFDACGSWWTQGGWAIYDTPYQYTPYQLFY